MPKIKMDPLPEEHKGFDIKPIVKSLQWHAKVLGLDRWDIGVGWRKVDGGNYAMECEAEWEYYKADIFIDLSRAVEGKIKYLDEYIRHELLHAIVWPLGQMAEKLALGSEGIQGIATMLEERVVSDLERAPFWDLLKEGG